MSTEFAIDSEHGLVVSWGTGVFGHADYLEHMERLGREAGFKPELNHLVDCRGFDAFNLTAGQLQDLGQRSIFAANSRRAFVVASQLQYGLSRMFASYREVRSGQTTMVFRTVPEALRWLDLPDDYDLDAVSHHASGPEPGDAAKG